MEELREFAGALRALVDQAEQDRVRGPLDAVRALLGDLGLRLVDQADEAYELMAEQVGQVEFRFRCLPVDGNIDLDFAPELSVGALETQIAGPFAGNMLTFLSGDREHTMIP